MTPNNQKPTENTSLVMLPPAETQLLAPEYPPGARQLTPYHYGYNNAPDLSERIQFGELWRRAYKHRWLIAAIALIVTSIAAVESYRTKSLYGATTTVEIAPEARTLIRSGDTVIETEESDSYYNVQATMKTKIKLLESRPLLEDVVAAMRLDQHPVFMDVTERKGVKEAIQTIFSRVRSGATTAAEPVSAEAPQVEVSFDRTAAETARLSPYVDVLSAHLTAAPIEETRMLGISYQHTDPLLAAQIANTIAKAFIQRSFKTKNQRGNAASDWLSARTRELKAKLEQAEEKLAEFSSRNDVSLAANLQDPQSKEGARGNVLTSKLANLQEQATKAETERILKESLYEEVRQGRVDKLPEAYSDARITALQNKLSELSITAAQNVGRYGPDNPRTTQSQKETAALQKQVDESRNTLADKLKADFERAQRDEKALKAALQDALVAARTESIQQNYAAVQFSLLKQEVETSKALYADFLQKNTQANMQLAEQTNNLHIIDPAQVARSPIGPNRMRSIMIALILSLCAGLGLALAIEFFDDTIKVTDDVTRHIGLPTLALIPSVQVTRKALVEREASALSANNSGNIQTALQQQSVTDPVIRTKALSEKSRNVLIEAYRSLRASIMLSTASQPPKTILFTSSQPGEGKTTTATNTGISLAQLGLSVLVIDADMRRPAVHRVFGLKRTTGLSSYLAGDVPIESLLQPTHIQNLSVMASGAIPPNPTELVSSERMRELLQKLSERYDHILIDSPPLLNVTDPVILSAIVDGVIIVVQSGRSKRHFVRRAHRELAQVGAKVFGVVLNNVDVAGEGYSDYEYARYRYEYGSEKKTGTLG